LLGGRLNSKKIARKMTWPVHISPLSGTNETTTGFQSLKRGVRAIRRKVKTRKICPCACHFLRRFLNSDRLQAIDEEKSSVKPAAS
jgi:hypothetical protein